MIYLAFHFLCVYVFIIIIVVVIINNLFIYIFFVKENQVFLSQDSGGTPPAGG